MSDGDDRIGIETRQDAEVAVRSGNVDDRVIRRQDLSGLDMAATGFRRSDLLEVGLTGARMKDCRLEACSLVGAAMRSADLSGTSMEGVEIRSCESMEATFAGAALVDVRFRETSLGNADFSGAELVGVVFSASDLYSASFRGAVLARTRFENRRLGNAVLSGADFTGAVVLDADFSSADLGGASFRNALVVETSFKDANITGADFEGAVLVAPDFTRANADQAARDATLRATVRPGRSGEAIMAFLKRGGAPMAAVVHAMLVGYVMRPESDVQPEGGTEEAPKETDAVPEPDAPEAVAREAPGGAEAPLDESPEELPSTKGVARESQEVYERFKKIELD